MPRRQCGNLPAPAREERIAADQERPCAQLGNGYKDRIEVAFGAGTQGMQLQRKLAGDFLQVSRLRLGIAVGPAENYIPHPNNSRNGLRGVQTGKRGTVSVAGMAGTATLTFGPSQDVSECHL